MLACQGQAFDRRRMQGCPLASFFQVWGKDGNTDTPVDKPS